MYRHNFDFNYTLPGQITIAWVKRSRGLWYLTRHGGETLIVKLTVLIVTMRILWSKLNNTLQSFNLNLHFDFVGSLTEEAAVFATGLNLNLSALSISYFGIFRSTKLLLSKTLGATHQQHDEQQQLHKETELCLWKQCKEMFVCPSHKIWTVFPNTMAKARCSTEKQTGYDVCILRLHPCNCRHAGVYTAEEVALITREKLIRLQSLYIDQFKRLQHLLKEKKRRYLHSRKVEHDALGDYAATQALLFS